MPSIKKLLAPDSISYGSNSPEWLVVHYTATSASAYNNAVYFSRGGNGDSSAHYFIDGGGTIYQSVPDYRGAWHAGNYECNTHSIGIEVVSDGADFTSSEISELAWLVQRLMGEYGIPASRVIRHHDVADHFGGYTVDPHKNCPAPYVDDAKWNRLKAQILEDDDEMTDAQIEKLAKAIYKQFADPIGEDKVAQWGPTGKGSGSKWRNWYNMSRWYYDLLVSINANVAKIVKKLGA